MGDTGPRMTEGRGGGGWEEGHHELLNASSATKGAFTPTVPGHFPVDHANQFDNVVSDSLAFRSNEALVD